MNFSEYKGIYVTADVRGDKMLPVTAEMIGVARRLADELGTKAAVLLAGSGVRHHAEELIALGADEVYVWDSPVLAHYDGKLYEDILAPFLEERKADILMGGSTAIGRDLIPRLAARLQCGLTADVTELSVDKESGIINWSRPAMADLVYVDIVSPGARPQAGTIHPGSFETPEKDETRTGQIVDMPVNVGPASLGAVLKEVIALQKEADPMEGAEVIVAGGRGIHSQEQWNQLYELAELLHGSVGATRPICELGWAPHSRQIGQTGKTVSPKVYFAFGISGAMLHLCGVKTDMIIAVNKDPDAPIFQVADYAVVADVKEFIPQFIEEIKKIRLEKKPAEQAE